MKVSFVSFLALIFTQAPYAIAKEISMEHIINADSDCANTGGNEVNRTYLVKAPEGSFFEKDTVKVYAEPDMRSFVDNAGPSGCFIRNEKIELLRVLTKNDHTINLPVLRSFEVYGHSDCGSGEARTASHIANKDRIRTDCSVKVQVYTADDLK